MHQARKKTTPWIDNNPLSPQNTGEEIEDQEILPEREESLNQAKGKSKFREQQKSRYLKIWNFL